MKLNTAYNNKVFATFLRTIEKMVLEDGEALRMHLRGLQLPGPMAFKILSKIEAKERQLRRVGK
jgi:hypothetical protein